MPVLPETHVHSFTRFKTAAGLRMYRCLHPDCYTTIDKTLLVGKRNLCPLCQKTEFLLSFSDLRRATPRCEACSNTKKVRQKRQIRSILEEILVTQEPTDA